MTNLKLTTALVATLAFAVPAFADTANTSAKSEALGATGAEATTEAEINAQPPVEGNAKYEAVTPNEQPGEATAEVDDNSRYEAVTGDGTAGAQAGASATVTTTAQATGTAEELDNTNERYDAVTPDEKLNDTDVEVDDNERYDAVTPEATLSGSLGVQADNARYEAVTDDERAGMSTEGSALIGAHVYDANGEMLGQVESTSMTGATVAFHDAEGFAVPKVTFKWEDLDFYKERANGNLSVFVRADKDEIASVLEAYAD